MTKTDYERKGSRVVIDDGGVKRALFKIQPLSDGGYAVLAPYHAAREGWLARVHVDYTKTTQQMSLAEMEHFSANDRVKLSHHADGFVQFSGENSGTIRSGRDPETGLPKGLAVQSAPIGLPIPTGPTFGVVAWGSQDFRELATLRNTDLFFPPTEIYYRNSTPYSWNAYLAECWVFWPRMWAGVRGGEFDLRLSVGFRNFEGSGSNLNFRVLPLSGSNCFIGVSLHRMKVAFQSTSGFQISGPSNRAKGATQADALMAMYPGDLFMSIEDATPLDYVPPVQPPSDPAMLGHTDHSDADGIGKCPASS